jgi:uncharacterized membrane protein
MSLSINSRTIKSKEITIIAVIAALYAALVIVLAPISFGPLQLRVADCLIPLAALFGMPAVIGVGLGAFIANTYWFLSPIDVFFGSIANIIAGYIIFRFKDRIFLACVTASIIIGGIVGGYLWLFFSPPSILGIKMPFWLAMIISISLSSLVAIAGIGYLLLETLKRSNLKYISS